MDIPLKECPKCLETKSFSDFSKDKQTKSGYSCYCKSCHKKYYDKNYNAEDGVFKKKITERNKIRARIIRQFVFDYLQKHPCIDCGESDPICLDFDHLSDKKIEVSILVKDKKPIEVISQEIEKCVVRCANCHRKKTAKDFGWYKDLIKEPAC